MSGYLEHNTTGKGNEIAARRTRHNSFSSGSNSNAYPLMDVIFNPKKNEVMNEFRTMVKSNRNTANELEATRAIARQGTYPRAEPTFARKGYPTATFKHNANRQKFYGESVNKINKKKKKRKTKKRLAKINNNNNNNKTSKNNKKKNATKKMNETKMGGGKRKSRRKVPLSILFGTKLSKGERLKRWKTLKKHKKNRTHKKRRGKIIRKKRKRRGGTNPGSNSNNSRANGNRNAVRANTGRPNNQVLVPPRLQRQHRWRSENLNFTGNLIGSNGNFSNSNNNSVFVARPNN